MTWIITGMDIEDMKDQVPGEVWETMKSILDCMAKIVTDYNPLLHMHMSSKGYSLVEMISMIEDHLNDLTKFEQKYSIKCEADGDHQMYVHGYPTS